MSRSAVVFIAFFLSLLFPFLIAWICHWALKHEWISLQTESVGKFPIQQIQIDRSPQSTQSWQLIAIEDDHFTSLAPSHIHYLEKLFQKTLIDTELININQIELYPFINTLQLEAGSILVINPQGYLAIYFEPNTPPKSMIKDLKKIFSR